MFKIGFYVLLLSYSILNVHGVGELVILSSPKTIKFTGNDELPSSILKDVFSAGLGYSVEQGSDWNGMTRTSPFGAAEGLLVMHVPEMGSFGSNYGASFPMMMDQDLSTTFAEVSRKTIQRYPDSFPRLEKIIMGPEIKLISGNQITELKVSEEGPITSVSSSRPGANSEHDKIFMKEMNKLHAVVDQILKKESKDGVPDVYWIELSELSRAMQLRGADSKQIMMNTMKTISQRVAELYNEKALVAVVTDDEGSPSYRTKRDAPLTYTPPTPKNIADDYSEDFPIIFNIILWFSIALLFALIAISMVIAGMDPGRDSIIYRMTSTRMKKDN